MLLKFVLLASAAVHNAVAFTRAKAHRQDGELEYAGYLMAHFTGEVPGSAAGEQIYFSLSIGNDPLHWMELNEGRPVIVSTLGEKGIRDPALIRAHNNSGFVMIATDLTMSYHNGDWDSAGRWGSRSLNVWESDDLVNWGEQRQILVAPVEAGMAWAPSAYYDESIGAYVVYWAANLYEDETHTGYTYQQMFFTVTPDFRSVGEYRPWLNLGPERSMIDSIVIEDKDGTYFRYTKDNGDEHPCGGSLYNDKSRVLTSTNWEFVADCITNDDLIRGEGPTAFQDNLEPDRWWMLVDEYQGRGYVPFTTTDLQGADWQVPDAPYQMPPSPRHGSVIPVTLDEYVDLLFAYGGSKVADVGTKADLRAKLAVELGM